MTTDAEEGPWPNHGAAWLRARGRTLSEVGERAADLVDWVWSGIYHVGREVLRGTWDDNWCAQFCLYGGLTSYDNPLLTRLVIGAHERALRVAVEPANPMYLRIVIYPRTRADRGVMVYHPTIEEAVGYARRTVRI